MHIRGCLATDCGYTEDQIDSLSFPFVSNLFKHWHKNPPTSWLLRWVHKYEAPERDKEANLRELGLFLPATGVNSTLPPEVNEYMRRLHNGG